MCLSGIGLGCVNGICVCTTAVSLALLVWVIERQNYLNYQINPNFRINIGTQLVREPLIAVNINESKLKMFEILF